jgi:hypothetical protein
MTPTWISMPKQVLCLVAINMAGLRRLSRFYLLLVWGMLLPSITTFMNLMAGITGGMVRSAQNAMIILRPELAPELAIFYGYSCCGAVTSYYGYHDDRKFTNTCPYCKHSPIITTSVENYPPDKIKILHTLTSEELLTLR